jgi:hypothetical protein
VNRVSKIILVIGLLGILAAAVSLSYGLQLRWPPYIAAAVYVGIGSSAVLAIATVIWGIDWLKKNVHIK